MLSLRDLALLPAKLVYTFACWPLLRLPVYYVGVSSVASEEWQYRIPRTLVETTISSRLPRASIHSPTISSANSDPLIEDMAVSEARNTYVHRSLHSREIRRINDVAA